jgi:phosphatidate cytidylyltransferase
MNKRYLGALTLSPLILVLFLGGIFLKVLVLILSIVGMYEFYDVAKKKGINPISSVTYLLCVVYYIFLIRGMVDFSLTFLMIVLAVFIMLSIPIINLKYNFIDIAVTILGYIYIPIFFSFIVLVNDKNNGKYLVWIIFISAWVCDTTAYYVGRYFGKHKLCPKVSPKKTIEGAIGGLIGSAVGCGIYGLVLNSIGVNIYIFNFILIGLFSGIFCQMGDLVASSIKRYVDVKDYGNLIPGHGGILDRFDSILFASFVVYYYITFIMGM